MPPGRQSQSKPPEGAQKPVSHSPDQPAPFEQQAEAPVIAARHLAINGGNTPPDPKHVRVLQRHVGNQAVQRLLNQHLQSPSVQDSVQGAIQRSADSGVIQRSVTLDGFELVQYNHALVYVRLRRVQLTEQRSELSRESVSTPAELAEAIEQSQGLESWCASGGERELDDWTAQMLRDWHPVFIRGFNAAEAAKARVAAERLAQAEQQVEAAISALEERILPALRDRQRAAFREENNSQLLSIADTIATVLDTALSCRTAIEAIAGERQALRTFVNTALMMAGQSPLANNRAASVLNILDRVNRVYAGFQLVRSGISLLNDRPTTEAARGIGSLSAITSAYGAAGTLLGVSAGVSAYSTFYLGPMVNTTLTAVTRLFDLISRTENRQNIEAGAFDLVRWNLEPGGRPMFNFMLRVMHASGSEEVPTPVPQTVADYFLQHESSFEAGTNRSQLPTSGWIWREIDQTRIARWVFINRRNLWGMLYGNTQVPTGELRL